MYLQGNEIVNSIKKSYCKTGSQGIFDVNNKGDAGADKDFDDFEAIAVEANSGLWGSVQSVPTASTGLAKGPGIGPGVGVGGGTALGLIMKGEAVGDLQASLKPKQDMNRTVHQQRSVTNSGTQAPASVRSFSGIECQRLALRNPFLRKQPNLRCPNGSRDCWYCSPSTFELWVEKRDAGINPFAE